MKTEISIEIDKDMSVRVRIDKTTTTEELRKIVNRVSLLEIPRAMQKRAGRPKAHKMGRPKISQQEKDRFVKTYRKLGPTKTAEKYGITKELARYRYYNHQRKKMPKTITGRPKGAKKKDGRGRPKIMSDTQAVKFCKEYEKRGKTKVAKRYGLTPKKARRRYDYYKNTKKIKYD